MQRDVHGGQRCMNGCAPNLDGYERVEDTDGGFEGDEVAILVGEDAKLSRLNAKANAGRDVLFGGLEPRVPLRCKAGLRLGLKLGSESTYLRGTASARRRRSYRSP